MKHFVVIAQEPTLDQQNAIMNSVIEPNGYAYWHWISNVWLLTDANHFSIEDARTLRDKIKDNAPGLHFQVFEVEPTTWAGWSDEKWADWLQQFWRIY